ncbi:MAG: hypothetical protein QM662_16680 [Gordonia sp. (in: high G+C Gram-positive bacteria)]
MPTPTRRIAAAVLTVVCLSATGCTTGGSAEPEGTATATATITESGAVTVTSTASAPITGSTPFTFGGIGDAVVGLPTARLPSLGVTGSQEPYGAHCQMIRLAPGAATVLVKNGSVIGARSNSGPATAIGGVGVGDPISRVATAIPGALTKVIPNTQGGYGVLLLSKPDLPGRYLGFAVDGILRSASSSAAITAIAAGDRNLASFFEICQFG